MNTTIELNELEKLKANAIKDLEWNINYYNERKGKSRLKKSLFIDYLTNVDSKYLNTVNEMKSELDRDIEHIESKLTELNAKLTEMNNTKIILEPQTL